MISFSGLIRTVFFVGAALWLLDGETLCAQAKPAAATDKPAESGPLNLEQEMQGIYQDAYSNFNLGKYDVALQKLAQIHAKTSNKEFEQVVFLEGACEFMLEKYDRAAELLQLFVDKYPKSESLVDATINLGRAFLKKGDETKGLNTLNKAVADFPARKGEIGLTIATYHKEKGKIDDARRILENITANAALSPEMVQSYLMLAEIYTGKGEIEKASAVMEKLKSSAADDDTIIQRNLLGLRIGDEMREKKLFKEALVAYQNVRKQSEILRIQKGRIARLEQWLVDAAAGKRILFLNRAVNKGEIESMLEANKKILEDIEKNKNFDADLYFRLGQCFFEMQRFYEAIAALNEVYAKFPGYANRELALYSMILANQNLQREARAYELCEKYMKEFPDAQFITQVSDLLGILAYKSGRISDAIRALQTAREAKGADKERINFLLGVVLFEAQRFDDSRDAFQALLKDTPKSAYKDDSEYRIALTHFFQNDSAKSRKALKEYIAGNPTGQYLVDAQYRLAFIEYQAAASNQGGDIAKARDILEKLATDNPNDMNIGQVWSLLGDIYSRLPSTGKENYTEMSMKAYMAAVDKAKSSDVLDYAIEAATNILTSESKWEELARMWQTYYTTNKDGPNALKAIYEIAMAYRRMGKPEEAQKLMAEHIAPNLGNPKNEQVEMLIQQLVGMIVPRKRAKAPSPAPKPAEVQPAPDKAASDAVPAPEKPAETAPATADGTPPEVKPDSTAPAAPAVTFEELEARLKQLLTGPAGADSINNGTAQARVLYARALLARVMRDLPKFESLLSVIPDAAKPEELSPLLLATVGDLMLAKGQTDKAAEYYGRLREAYSASDFGDKAPVGLGKIEFAKKNYQGALDLFNEAIEKYQGSSSILDATMGKAEALLELGKLDDAEKLYKTVAATREWKGEPTASGLFHLGLIEEKRKEWGKAIAYYQRVILAHQKYKNWLAKAHLHCAQCQINDGKNEDASIVLRQMLARTDLQDQPEFKEAQALLNKVGN